MTPFCFVVATVPLALYFLALGCLRRRPKPFVVDGRRDFIALCLALSGVFFVGPGSILPPFGAMVVWRASVWVLCGLLCFCVVVLVSSLRRPRIVAYNATREQTRAALSRVAISLDDEARWAGSSLNLPSLGVQFYLDDAGWGRVATLVGFGPERSPQGWLRLEKELRREFDAVEPTRRRGWLLFAALGWGTLLADAAVWACFYREISDAFRFYLSV
ncbi:MAG: hypothetical protein IKU86_03600 [Thermoguttaceae bacterium]|nr:hypothetical protein [Thermoguttaceae bacterium]